MSKLNERGGSKTQNQDVEDVRTADAELHSVTIVELR